MRAFGEAYDRERRLWRIGHATGGRDVETTWEVADWELREVWALWSNLLHPPAQGGAAEVFLLGQDGYPVTILRGGGA